MIAKIVDNHWIYLDQVTQGSEESLEKYFSVRSPNARYLDLNGSWDGWHRKYNKAKSRLALPLLQELILCCKKNNIPLDIYDERGAPKYPAPQPEQITGSFLDGITLEEYQISGVKACCNNEIGLVVATTGGGKTELICAAIKAFRCPTVILTEQTQILEQIVSKIKLRNVVHKDDIGMFCSGSMPDGNLVCIGNMQSVSTPSKPKFEEIKLTWRQACQHVITLIQKEKLEALKELMPERLAIAIYNKPEGIERLTSTQYARSIIERIKQQSYRNRMQWYKTRYGHAKEIQDYIKSCDMCLVDEADLAVSQPYSILFRSFFNGRRKYGFTGTPFDKTKPVQNITLKENLGSVIYEVPREKVQEAGRIIPVKCYFIPIGTDGDKKDTRAHDIAQKEDIIENELFHNKVCKLNESFKHERNLIVVDTNPITSLGLALEQKIPNSKFLYNKSKKSERRKYIKMFENGTLQCLLAGKILKRGFDLNGGCDNLIIIGGGKQWSNINQIVGRAVRLNKRGWARIFLFFSLSNKYLYDHSRENLKAIVDLGYPTKIIYNGKMIDAKTILKSRFRFPSK